MKKRKRNPKKRGIRSRLHWIPLPTGHDLDVDRLPKKQNHESRSATPVVYFCSTKVALFQAVDASRVLIYSVPESTYGSPKYANDAPLLLFPQHARRSRLTPSSRRPSSHDCQLDDTAVAAHGTVSVWFGSASQVTLPDAPTTMYLYSTTVPGVRATATLQSGLLVVYCEALRGTALPAAQFPSVEMFPALW